MFTSLVFRFNRRSGTCARDASIYRGGMGGLHRLPLPTDSREIVVIYVQIRLISGGET